MSSLLPRKRPPDTPDPDITPRVLPLEGTESTAVFDALSSTVSRAVLSRLLEDPATQSELAEQVGTTIQNVNYHVDKLQSAGLIEVVDEWYSEKGKQMDVYAPVHDPILLITGERYDTLLDTGMKAGVVGELRGSE